MGMFDEVWFEEQVPGIQSGCRRFQTKSLHRSLDRYLVTKEGRLLLVGHALLGEPPPDDVVEFKATDTDFHGDMRLVADEGAFENYIARFTHGTLEWVRPLDEVPEIHRPPG